MSKPVRAIFHAINVLQNVISNEFKKVPIDIQKNNQLQDFRSETM
jgi:hypothetical protein